MKKKSFENKNINSFLFTTCGASLEQCSAYSAVLNDSGSADIKISYFLEGTGSVAFEFTSESSVLEGLNDVIQESSVTQWDGFKPVSFTKPDVEGFRLEARYNDGTKLSAEAYAQKPKGYEEGRKAIADYFMGLIGR